MSSEHNYEIQSVDKVVNALGFEINQNNSDEKNMNSETINAIIDLGQAIDEIGTDEGNLAQEVYEQSKQSASEDENESNLHSECGSGGVNWASGSKKIDEQKAASDDAVDMSGLFD